MPAPMALLLCEQLSSLLLLHLPHHDGVQGHCEPQPLPLLKLLYQAFCQGDREVTHTHTEKTRVWANKWGIGTFSRNERNVSLISYFIVFIILVSWKRHFYYCLKHKFKKNYYCISQTYFLLRNASGHVTM